jgi:predicted PurR-regulated permease PerM
MLTNSGGGGGVSIARGGGPEARLAFWWGLLVRLALAAAAVYFLYRVRTILTTVLVALIISCAASALVEPLMRRRVRFLKPHTQRLLATTLVYVGLCAVVLLTVRAFIDPFQSEFHKLSENYPAYQAALTERITEAQGWYARLSPDLRRFLEDQRTKLAVPSPTAWLSGVVGSTLAWASHIVELILIPVLAFYFTLDGRKLRNEFLFLVPQERLRPTFAIFSEGAAIMRAYIISQFWLAFIAGVVVWAGLRMLGMDYAIVLGLLAGITRAIPVIGPLLGGVPIVLLSFVYGAQHGNPWLWVWVLSFFTLLHLVESKIIMPRFLGHALNLHAVVIIIVLLIGGEFFGLMGMFLAAPVAALARLLLLHYVIRPRRRTPARPVLTTVPGSGGGTRVLRLERAVRTSTAATATTVLPSPPKE